jgi:dUTP pyrophosphatase
MKVKLKRLSERAVIPRYANPGDGALDLVATSERFDVAGYVEYGTSIAIALPPGYIALLFPRSSISNKDLILANSVGLVDEQYTGELKFRFKSLEGRKARYKIGERIGQIMIMPRPSIEFEEVAELPQTVRGSGGFGSSGA